MTGWDSIDMKCLLQVQHQAFLRRGKRLKQDSFRHWNVDTGRTRPEVSEVDPQKWPIGRYIRDRETDRNIPRMSPKNIRMISHPELEIYLYWSNFSKNVSQLTDWQTYKKFKMICKYSKNILGMSKKNFRKISHPEPKISLYKPKSVRK